MLGALADALCLRVPDRILLRRPAKESGDDKMLCSAAPPAHTVRPTVRALFDRLEPTPAVLLNWLGDIVAHTSGYERFARPLGLLDGDPPNVMRYLFTDARARAVYPGWERFADEQVAHLRHEAPLHDPYVAALAEELTVTAGARFTLRLKGVPAMPLRNGTDLVEHPEAGRLRLSYETLALPDDGQRLMVHLPADEATATALDHLNGLKPGALRAVSG